MAFFVNKSEHVAGDRRCVECYAGYPAKCVCGGFIHAQFVKEDWEGFKDIAFLCDRCGDKFKFPGQKAAPKKYRRKFNKHK